MSDQQRRSDPPASGSAIPPTLPPTVLPVPEGSRQPSPESQDGVEATGALADSAGETQRTLDPGAGDRPGTPSGVPLTTVLPNPSSVFPRVSGRHPLPPQTQVGNYVLLERVGQGGMGIVYRARHLVLPRVAAVKMMLEGTDATQELARFRKDAGALALIEHEHIVRIYDFDHDDTYGPYFALEFVEGGSLADRLRKDSRWEFRRAARLVEMLARATHFAHEHNIVHRDLKPGNVLLAGRSSEKAGESGLGFVPKITDFGLAKTCPVNAGATNVTPVENLTYLGAVMGTPSYMAPEQAEGHPNVSHPADVYALGAILFELLTGRPPFVGSTFEVLAQVQNYSTPSTIRPHRPDIPAELEAICRKCLERDPASRYASAEELAEALRSWQGVAPASCSNRLTASTQLPPAPPSAPSLDSPPSWPIRLGRLARRRPVRTAVIVLAAALLCFGIYLGYDAGSAAWLEREAEGLIAQGEQAAQDQARLKAAAKFGDAQEKYERLVAAHPDRPNYRIKVAEMMNRQGIIYCEIREWESAEKTFNNALDELKKLRGQPETPVSRRDYQLKEAEANHYLGVLFNDRDDNTGGYENQKSNWRKAQEYYKESKFIRKLLEHDCPRDSNDLPQIRRDLARSYGFLGDTFLKLGRDKDAWKEYQGAEEIRKDLAQKADDLDAQMQLARSYANTGNYHRWRGEPKEALDQFRKALKHLKHLMDQHGTLPPSAPYEFKTDYAYYCNVAAQLLMGLPPEKQDRPEVLKYLEEAQAIYEPPALAHPKDPYLVNGLGQTYLLLGEYHLADRETARGHLQKALELLRGLPTNLRGTDYLVNYSLVLALQSELSDDGAEKKEKVDSAAARLDGAYRRGYNDLGRLETDRGFEALRSSKPQKFVDLIKALELERKR
jgi:serine/threonine protein kinase